MIVNIVNTFDTDIILPVSLVDENMKRAHLRDALTKGTFWWKVPTEELANVSRVSDLEETNFLKSNTSTFGRPKEDDQDNTGHYHFQHHHPSGEAQEKKADAKLYKELTIAQILDGDANVGLFKGLIILAEEYMEINDWEED